MKQITNQDLYDLLETMRREVRDGYVHKQEFLPVKSIVYGMVALILTGVATALVAQVVKAVL